MCHGRSVCFRVRPDPLPRFILLLAAVYGYWVPTRWYRAVPLLILTGWITTLSGRGYRSLRTTLAGLDQIALGMACLLVGLMVSLWKLGIPQAWWARWFEPPPLPAAPMADRRTDRQGK